MPWEARRPEKRQGQVPFTSIPHSGKDKRLIKKLGPCTLLMGTGNGTAAVGNTWVAPQYVKHRIAMQPSNCTPSSVPKRIENNYSNICTQVFKYLDTRPQVETRVCHLMNGWAKCGLAGQGSHTILIPAARWVNLNITILSEISRHKGHLWYQSFYMNCPERKEADY